MHFPLRIRPAALLAAVLLFLVPVVASAKPVVLADDGKAAMEIVVSPTASDRVIAAAAILRDYLGQMTGAEFEVVERNGFSGIVVGQRSEFDASLPIDAPFTSDPLGREDYVLKSATAAEPDAGASDVLYVIGASDLAVEHAVWDLLYRLGYRQFFPTSTWEVIPSLTTARIDIDTFEQPDFHARRIWYNWGMNWGYNVKPYHRWSARNRAVKGFNLNSGHAYGAIIAANRKAFDEHPEYFPLLPVKDAETGEITMKRGGIKFCVSNLGLQKLVADWAVAQIVKNPNLDSISTDPSDGGGWCECEPCKALGSVSDRALTLANIAAEAMNNHRDDDRPYYVGMYAYNQHSPPPTIQVHPNVIMSATTAFITGGYTLQQIIDGWKAKGATLGIYDYLSVIAWDWNRPRAARGARPHGVAKSIVGFHDNGARFYDAESGDAWGPYGLGFYVASRVLWDVTEADRVDDIIDDFLTKSFGPAKEPMANFYHLINIDNQRRSSEDLIARMYRSLAEARELAAGNANVIARIDDLIKYTRYAELYEQYAGAVGDAKANHKDTVTKFVYRIRETEMLHSYGIWARMPGVGQRGAGQADHPLKDDRPFTEAEIVNILAAGVKNNQPVEVDFEQKEYSKELLPAQAKLNLDDTEQGNFPNVAQDRQAYWIWMNEPGDVNVKVTVQKVWANKPHKITLFSPKDVQIKAVAETGEVNPDGKTYDVHLATPYDGLHQLITRDGGDYTRIAWPEDMPVTVEVGMDSPSLGSHFRGQWTAYFYVPKGTKIIGGWANRVAQWAPRISGVIKDSAGEVHYDFGKVEDGWFTIDVPEGQDGQLWKFENNHGVRQLATVPPYIARSARELLLPAEVIEADAAARAAE